MKLKVHSIKESIWKSSSQIKMSFGELPEELIIEHLSRLPFKDLLSTCQTDVRFSEICRGKRLWQTLIRNGAPYLNLREISDPRDFFYRTSILGEGIYVNFELQPYKLGADPVTQAKMIAASLGQPYVIAYTVFDPTPDHPDYKTLFVGYETPYLSAVAHSMDIRRVDIITLDNLPERTRAYLDLINELVRDDQRARAQIFNITYTENGRSKTDSVDAFSLQKEIPALLLSLVKSEHKRRKTPFYGAMMSQRERIREELAVPSIPNPVERGDLKARKEEVLKNLLESLSSVEFSLATEDEPDFLGYTSYQEFVDAQREFVDQMDESQIQTLEFLQTKILPISMIYDWESEVTSTFIQLVLNLAGRPVFITQ